MRNFTFVFIVLILGVLRVQSQSVSLEEAEQVAQHFLGKVHKSMQTCASVSVDGKDTLLYVFNANNGFVVVSGEKKAIPILAYSTESNYNAENVIPPVQMWMDYYQNQLIAIKKDANLQQSVAVANSWKELATPFKQHKNTGMSPAPLLTSKWGQGKYYNYYCPKDDAGTNKRAVTGCVATAMAQLLYYFRYPQTGIDTHSYEHPLYGTLSADFGATNYDYQAMEAQPNRINLPASLLTSHCGIAANMNYGAAASAAWSEDAANALINNFGYSPETQLIHRWEADNWDSLIVSHLDRRIPLYFAGTDTTKWVGHAFVCDAYQVDTNDNYFYHFNFGWEGYQDGYFYINPLLGESIAYHYGQDIIINAYPDTAKFDYPSQSPLTGTTILIEETGSFTDGIDDCPPNMDYTWIIRPDIDAITYIKLSLNYQLAEGDSLFITSLNGNVNHIFTYDTSSFLDNIADQEIIIRLKTTNDSIPSGGITASYTAEYGMFCKKGIDKYSLKTGSFGDGSKESRYRNNTDCIYWIEVAGVHSITIRFTTFETEKDRDILSIRDRAMGSVPLLMELSGNYTDSVYTFNTNSLILDFITDDINVYQGWELTYETDVPIEDLKNINTFDGDNHCYIYPNPATNHLYVSVDDLLQDGQIHLFDVYGRLLLKHVIREKESQVNLNALAPGMYIVKVMDGERLYTVKRIIKE